jgi:predicted metal-dependent hydrolase
MRKKMKSVTVRIRDGRILVSAPPSVSFARIEAFLRERQDFILRAIDTTLAREAEKQEAFVCREGARVPWMG